MKALILIIFVSALLLFGCSGQQAQAQPPSPAPVQVPVPAPVKNVTPAAAQENKTIAPAQNYTNVSGAGINQTASNKTEEAQMPRGTKDPNLEVEIYDPEKVFPGTTLFSEYHDAQHPRIVEVNMLGEVVWQYLLPDNLKQYVNPGFAVSRLANNHILFVLPLKGVYEIDRNGTIVWSYLDAKVSHDVQRLANGDTLVAWGGADTKEDAQVKEISPEGKVVWSWHAKDYYGKAPYSTISRENSWTHTNAATRLANGDTIISLRNFELTIEVSPSGSVVWSYDWSSFGSEADPHGPELLPNDDFLACLPPPDTPAQAVEINRTTGKTVWTYYKPGLMSSRDCDRLPNGNTMIVTVDTNVTGGGPGGRAWESRIIEVTQSGEIVWQLGVTNAPYGRNPGWLYKAERIPLAAPG